MPPSQYLTDEFEKADRNLKPDPGRVTARRLNRSEYTNTIRDLLAVEFRAEQSFPTDDLGNGFDNIGDVLTISPGADGTLPGRRRHASPPAPSAPTRCPSRSKSSTPTRTRESAASISAPSKPRAASSSTANTPSASACRASAPPTPSPSCSAFWMDGKLLHSMPVETKPSRLVYFDPYSEEQMRLFLPEGDHVFRAALHRRRFRQRPDAPRTPTTARRTSSSIRSPSSAPTLPRPSRASRKKIFICDPNSGAVCVEKIVSNLAHRAYRRPVTKAEIASLLKFVAMAKANGQSTEQGIQLAIQAMLVSPHFLFRIERDPNPPTPPRCTPSAISNWLRASAISCGVRCPTTSCSALAEAGKLRAPATLDAQVKRMLADPRSSALADNFAGQWLELRNLDVVKPDPQKFPDWSPELRDAMKHGDAPVLRLHAAREPPALRFPRRALHVPQRAAGEALRHRRREGPGVPQGRTRPPISAAAS